MKKILSFMVATNLITLGTISVVSCSTPKKINLPENEVIDLSKIKEFEIEVNDGQQPNEILRRVLSNSQFKNVGYDDVKIKDGSLKMNKPPENKPVKGEIIIESTGKNEKIIGVTPTIILNVYPELKDLNKLNLKLNIGEVKGYTTDIIINKFIEVNKSSLVDTNETGFTIKSEELTIEEYNTIEKEGKGKAIIRASASSKFYYGAINVNFTIIKKIDLKDVIKNTDLGDVANNSAYEVCHTLLVKNPNLENNIDFGYGGQLPGKTEATIYANSNHLYAGSIDVTFNCLSCN